MPRWANGWGCRPIRLEDTADERSQRSIEGVHPRRWIRVTYKIPFIVHGRRTGANGLERGLGPGAGASAQEVLQSDGLSGSWSLTLHVFLPLETTDLGHSDELAGLSASYAYETHSTPSTWAGGARSRGRRRRGTSPRATGARSPARPSNVGCGSTARCAAAGLELRGRRRLLEFTDLVHASDGEHRDE